MTLRQKIESYAERGMVTGEAKAGLLAAAEETEERQRELEEALEEKEGELVEKCKLAALEKAILEAGGRNGKAILALLHPEEIRLDEQGELIGLDLEQVKAEAPYLFQEKRERKTGTGVKKSRQKKKAEEIRAAFRKGLGR